MFPLFNYFSETPCMKLAKNVFPAGKNPAHLITEGRFPAGERFHFLLLS